MLIRKWMKSFIQTFRISFILIPSLLCLHCRPAEQKLSVELVSKNDKAVGMVIRGVDTDDHNELPRRLKVQLIHPGQHVPVLGEFEVVDGQVTFEPLVPFTRGLKYEVLLDDALLATVEVPAGEFNVPELLSIYPSQDTLPENLLKMYFEFSDPMVEGQSLSYITLIRNDVDTLEGTFLALQPELWNADGTVLTLWLDPGRIKRDLIPNKELGSPLKANEKYTLHVRKSWLSKNGLSLSKNYAKDFVTISRDDDSPDPARWAIKVPPAGKKHVLEIQFPEALDYFLMKEGIAIKNSKGHNVAGTIEIDSEEKVFRFSPNAPWDKGHFVLHIEGRLEDLAGNNLNRPFDHDIDGKNKKQSREIFTKEFEIP